MTQTQILRAMFEEHGGVLTLGQIMESYLAASYRQRMTDLRRELASEGKTIKCSQCHREGLKSTTEWRIESLEIPAVTEPTGQRAFAI